MVGLLIMYLTGRVPGVVKEALDVGRAIYNGERAMDSQRRTPRALKDEARRQLAEFTNRAGSYIDAWGERY